VAALGAVLLLAFVLQAAVVGASALDFRMLEPIRARYDRTIEGRHQINKATLESWRFRPVVGHGAGSTNQLSVSVVRRSERVWNGNLVLFVLHDSGLIGVGALVWLGVVLWRRMVGALASGGASIVALLAIGGGLCFAYQFTHGLWLMYPYVF